MTVVLGLAILSFFGFGLETNGFTYYDVMFMIMAVVAAAASNAGGLDHDENRSKSYVSNLNTLRLLRQQ